ncbi:hypothetical protein [Pasteurella multocida]|uniref:hypothetical protein n=1 Tax=Pasteurella multocida TaxID=747 RepID=UPI00086AC175|nr:hypothetical protein [Pasteurella multocida]MDA5609446.1 hypothetical protein [Pasteurella multocida subsp. multocida]MDA5616966.1 hypothetical protein [Pasteurella multocida]MDA5626991.1 hypothetical protein [Pasteurella multocida]MDY0489347.1 hypothetical protein [Pasteurella multocida]ODS43149.1 hypothetical protein BGK37_12625 [Pasteurella multocida]
MIKKLIQYLKSKGDLIDEINELKGVLDEKCRALVKLRADSQHRESELLREIEFKNSQIADFEHIRQAKDEYIQRLKIKFGQMAHENRMRNKKKSKFNKKGI